ncbi:histidine kinase [Granulosicoccaceae sp. 1_MG-2023]|nr:histidine kinase [Granulosicoccaceae sp. 1_MG-2023]
MAKKSFLPHRLYRLWFPAHQSEHRSHNRAKKLALSLMLSNIGIFLLLLLSLLFFHSHLPLWAGIGYAVVLLAGLSISLFQIYGFSRYFLSPLLFLRRWLTLVLRGNLSARIPVHGDEDFASVADDLNMLSAMLKKLTEDAEAQLRDHTRRITAKNRSLQILYELSASITYSTNMDELLSAFINSVSHFARAEAAILRLCKGDQLCVAKSSHPEIFEGIYATGDINLDSCEHARRVAAGELAWLPAGESLRGGGRMVSVPLSYRNKVHGTLDLIVDEEGYGNQDELESLLLSVGQHCGMAIEKIRLDEETQRLTIMQERERLSHELHDSLAQTLVSLRFQIRVLDESVGSDDRESIATQIVRIENTIDEANTELRELITYFRAPIDRRGILSAVERLVRRFQDETDISIFLQREWPDVSLPLNVEMQVLRIVQETLANIRKHSHANTVRLILRGNDDGEYYVLVEDDGAGFDKPISSAHPGEHIGLGIMRERAQKIGGTLLVDSEAGEGTRVVLRFNWPEKQRAGLSHSSNLLHEGTS